MNIFNRIDLTCVVKTFTRTTMLKFRNLRNGINSFLNEINKKPDRLLGPYGTWGEANNAAIGYKTDLEVFDGRADRIRDGKEEPPMDVPALLAAISMASPARVLDFGGGTAFGYLCASRFVADKISNWRW